MKKYIVLILLFTITSFDLHCQFSEDLTFSKHKIGLQIGLAKTLLKDINYSPLNYVGQGISISLFYERALKDKHFFIASLNYLTTSIQARDLEATMSTNNLTEIEFTYLHRIKNFRQRWSIDFGGGLSTMQDFTFFEDSDALTYFNFHGLKLASRLSYSLAIKHEITSLIKIPVVGNLVRPSYTGWDNESVEKSALETAYKGKFTSINEFFALSWNNAYVYVHSNKINFTVQVGIQYHTTNIPKLTKNMQTQFSIGTNLKF